MEMSFEEKTFNTIETKLGTFELNEKYECLIGSILWLGNDVSVFLKAEDIYERDYHYGAFDYLFPLLKNQKQKDFEFRKFASQKLTSLANHWRDDEVEPIEISEENFANRISITSIKLDYNGIYAIYFNDDGMFSGYQVMVYGNPEHDMVVANMELDNWREPLYPTYWGDL